MKITKEVEEWNDHFCALGEIVIGKKCTGLSRVKEGVKLEFGDDYVIFQTHSDGEDRFITPVA
jgi:hypothetical protein